MSESQPKPEVPQVPAEDAAVPSATPSGASAARAGDRGDRRRTLMVLAGILSALVLVAWLVVAPLFGPGTTGPGGPAVPGTALPRVGQESPAAPGVSVAAPPVIPPVTRGDSGFSAELGTSNGDKPVDPDTLGVARQVCSSLESGASRAGVERAVLQAGRFDQKTAEALVSAAVHNFCPDRKTTAVTTIKDGTWQAGPDVEPGPYATTAGDGCDWQRSTSPDPSSLTAIIDSGTGAGRKTVMLEAGQYLLTSRCGEWSRER